MNQYKVCVYAISKNEERHVARFMDCASEADLVLVLDTGSEDNTVEELRNRGAIVYSETIEPWRFDSARNRALALVPEDVDICVVADIDEVYEKGWREELEKIWQPEYDICSVNFIDAANQDGVFPPVQRRFRIHKRHEIKWDYPVHELIFYTGQRDAKRKHFENIHLGHFPDKSKSRAQYKGLLKINNEEHPRNAQRAFLLIWEFIKDKEYEQCLDYLRQYMLIPNVPMPEERSCAMWLLAYCLEMTGHKPDAKEWLLRSIAECPTVREPYMKTAIYAFEEGDWLLCYDMAIKGLRIKTKTHHMYSDPHCWGYVLYDYAAQSAYRLGRYKEAVEYGIKACSLDQRTRLQTNLTMYFSALNSK